MRMGSGLGIAGAISLVAGTFFPLVDIPILGIASGFTVSPTMATAMLVAATVGAYFSVRSNWKGVGASCLLSFVVVGLLFYATLIHIGLAEAQVNEKLNALAGESGMSAKGLPVDALMSQTHLGSGWTFLLCGSAVLLLASVLLRRGARRVKDLTTGQAAKLAE